MMLDVISAAPNFFAVLFFVVSVYTNYHSCVHFHFKRYAKSVGYLVLTFIASLLMFAAVGSGMQP